MRSLLLVSLLWFPWVALAEGPTGRQIKAQAYAEQAEAALLAGQFDEALVLSEKALKKDEHNLVAHFARGGLLLQLSTMATDAAEQQRLMAEGTAELQIVSRLDPDGVRGGIARGFLLGSTARAPLQKPAVECPADSEAAFAAAEKAFAAHDVVQARLAYLLALSGCPNNSTWHVYLGDAYYAAGENAEALRRYQHALTIDPCDWQAHRFIADFAVAANRGDESYEHLTEALACNPTYQEARGQLSDTLRAHRSALTWPDAPAQSAQSGAGEPWRTLAYQRHMAFEKGVTPMEAERAAVKATLAVWRANPGTDGTFRLLEAADTAGHLDVAIYALLLDQPLHEEFVAWRADHRPELLAYIREVLAVWP